MSDAELAQQDMAVVNLLCATDLPSADPLDIPQCLWQLDEWAEYARQETINGYPLYRRNPDPNKGSESVYKLWSFACTPSALSPASKRNSCRARKLSVLK